MSETEPPFSACVLIPAWRSSTDLPGGLELLKLPLYRARSLSQPARAPVEPWRELVLGEARGDGALLLESLRQLQDQGFTHALVFEGQDRDLSGSARALVAAAESEPSSTILLHGAGLRGPWPTRLALWTASGLRLQDPWTRSRCYALPAVVAHHYVMSDEAFELELLVKLAWNADGVREIEQADCPPSPRPTLSWRRMFMFLRLTSANWFLPPAFLVLATRQSFQALSRRERLRESLNELLSREPGSNERIAASAAIGLFLSLTPIWGLQILLTIYLCHRWRLSKTVALLCTNISVPPLIPFIMYGSLVLGRVLLGGQVGSKPTSTELAAQDWWPWIVGSFALATIVGLIGGALVWIIVSLARRMRVGREA